MSPAEIRCDPCSKLDDPISVLILLLHLDINERENEVQTSLNLIHTGMCRLQSLVALS